MCRAGCDSGLSVGTFNIRTFPTAATDMDSIVDHFGELDTTLFAVQEIMDPTAFEAVLLRGSRRTGRQWKAIIEPYCSPARVWLAIVYDTDRVTLRDVRTHAELDRLGRDACRETHPPALYAEFDHDGERVGLMNVHMKAGGEAHEFGQRKRQWSELRHSIASLTERLGAAPIVVGDFNTTGWTDDRHGEREFIDDTLDDLDLDAATEDLECTMYWQPTGQELQPSVLDHVFTEKSVDAVEALGICKKLKCQSAARHRDYIRVSDHCPVRVVFD